MRPVRPVPWLATILAVGLTSVAGCSSDPSDSSAGTAPAATDSSADSGPSGSEQAAGAVTVSEAAEATAAIDSGTATTELVPAADSGSDGARIAVRFSADRRDCSILTLTEADGYSGVGPIDHEIRLVDGEAYYRSIELDDGWFRTSAGEPTQVLDTVPAGFDPVPSPLAGLDELLAGGGSISEVSQGRYLTTLTMATLRGLTTVPPALALLDDPELAVPDDQEIALTVDIADGLLARLEARPSGGDYGAEGPYAAPTVTTTFTDLGNEIAIEAPADAIDLTS